MRVRGTHTDSAGLDLDAKCGKVADQITTKKPKTVDPYGGIDEQGEFTRFQCGLPAALGDFAWQLTTYRAEELLAALDLIEQRGNRVACTQVPANVADALSHGSSLGDS